MGKCDMGGRKRTQISSGKDMGFGISEYRLYVFSIFFKETHKFQNSK